MKTTNPVDAARIELMLSDLRLPAIKSMWAKLAEQSAPPKYHEQVGGADASAIAMGAYTAFLDVALGFGTPALGLLARSAGLGVVFVVSALAALCAAPIAASFLYASIHPVPPAGHAACR
jgi:predicted MFS family arabinose efflux permease